MTDNTKIEKYKTLINQAKELYALMSEDEVMMCEDWLDEEFHKENNPQNEQSLLNSKN